MHTIFDILKILRWEDTKNLSQSLLKERLGHISKLLIQKINNLDKSQRTICLSHLSKMADEDLHRVLKSPRIVELLYSKDSNQKITELIVRESQAASHFPSLQTTSAKKAGWSALGDRWLGPVHISGRSESDLLIKLACDGGLSATPLPIDLSLSDPLSNPSAGLTSTRTISIQELKRISVVLQASLLQLAAICPPAHKLVTEHTSNVVIRQESDLKARVRSASSPISIGRTVLLNINQTTNIQLIQECLIHEAVHACLSGFELKKEFVSHAIATSVVSPWTGNTIPLRALVHATFVWYALFAFNNYIAFSSKQAENTRKNIYQGFKNLELDNLEGVEKSCLAAINQIKQEVVRA